MPIAISEFAPGRVKMTPEERQAMDALVEAKTVESFDSTDFPDEYRGRLEQLIAHYVGKDSGGGAFTFLDSLKESVR